ncbi:hypothetical protein [Arenimonas oryziterrae]|uniref:hypothetical protein n=1 Tax=Arenimonas oryziterrae TaxID=498055 RepID=UPI0012DC36DB|nr:hypothetical protein [Arenimonas oryziterrae]
MKIPRNLILLSLLAISMPLNAANSALQVTRSKDGFLFVGPKGEESFSFDVAGKTIRTADDDGRLFAEIDGILIQLTSYPIAELPEGDALTEHQKYETDYLKKHTIISNSSVCSGLAIPHREWKATLSGVSTSTYLTIKLKRSILIVVVAVTDKDQAVIARQKLASICSKLKA